MDPTPKRSNASRSRYDEDPGVDRFYTGAHEHNTIATGVKTTCAPLPAFPRSALSFQ